MTTSAVRPRQRRTIDVRNGRVEMLHGAGGRAMGDLIDAIFRPHLSNPLLDQANDQAVFAVEKGRMAMTTDSYVISPLFFPGGDIGSLAVHGTVNDLAMCGARPVHLSMGIIIEEGFAFADLERIARSIGEAARAAGVAIVSGDTKVVERGKADGVFINTAGIGIVPKGVEIGGDRARPGDKVVVSGTIGDHGVAIMSHRAGLEFETQIVSDSAALNGLVDVMIGAVAAPGDLRVLRDPTRGGVAACLNEIAHQSGVGFQLDETMIPIAPQVQGACELLGLDPLNVANEGKLVAIAAADAADAVLAAMHQHQHGRNAAIVGTVTDDPMRLITMKTQIGGERVIDWLAGEQMPRIC